MMVVHFSTSDSGGAGIAAARIHQSLLNSGAESYFISLHKFRNDVPNAYSFRELYSQELNPVEHAINNLNKLKRRITKSGNYYSELSKKYLTGRPEGFELFTLPESEFDLSRLPIVKKADIVHLHWVTEGFMDFKSFFKNINNKIVWTLHDMNPFTGGCHHADDCKGFMDKCENCPQLKGTIEPDLALNNLKLKKASINNIESDRMVVVSPSQWLMDLSKKSALFGKFKHVRIANPVDENVFKSSDRNQSRINLGLPIDKKIILFTAKDVDNPRKGIRYLLDAVSKMKDAKNVVLCSVGQLNEKFVKNMNHINIGYVNDDRKMAMLYSAADVFVLPSIAENFPNTICESLMCGTPVAAFNVGGIPELINPANGILAPYRDVQGLTNVIENILADTRFNQSQITNDARENFSLQNASAKYIEVYSKLLN